MKSEAVKLAQIQERQTYIQTLADSLTRILTNPAVVSVAGTIAIEYFQGHDEVVSVPVMRPAAGDPNTQIVEFVQKVQRRPGDGFVGSMAGSLLEVGLIAYMGSVAIKEMADVAAKVPGAVGAVKGLL